MSKLHSKAIMLYGPPGSGKGTQASLVADALGIVHIDTGHLLEQILHDPAHEGDAEIQKERKNFDEGRLNTPEFVVRVLKDRVKAMGKSGIGLVFSGSPRTLYEAERLIPILEEYYNKEQVYVFVLEVSDEVSIERNSKRLLCTECSAPLLTEYVHNDTNACPRCGGELYQRTLDNPETIKVRLDEYKKRTKPIFSFMEERGYSVNNIDGQLAPYRVFHKIKDILDI